MYINTREELLPDTFCEPAPQTSSSCYSKVDEERPWIPIAALEARGRVRERARLAWGFAGGIAVHLIAFLLPVFIFSLLHQC